MNVMSPYVGSLLRVSLRTHFRWRVCAGPSLHQT
ncbi:unnamed protein product [Arabidopsis halleri]